MNPNRRRIAGLMLLSLPMAAGAQETVDTVPVQALPETTATPSPGEQSQPVELEKVTVTGELLKRDANKTISSVAVQRGKDIEKSTAQNVYDVIRATPNASLNDNDYGVGSMTLRGIASYGASGSGAYAAYSTASAVVFDGVSLPRAALGIADLSAFDLASVEIFRGPQSTSQGRNAMAGAVVVNTIEPTIGDDFSPELRGRLSRGNKGNQQGAAAVGATLMPETLAVRAVYDWRADDGDIYNDTRNDDKWAKQRSHNVRARAHWQPFGADGPYRALLSFSDIDRYAGSTYLLQSEEEARVSHSDAPQYYANHSQLAALDQRLRLGERWNLRAVSAYIRSDTTGSYDSDYSARDGFYTLTKQLAHAFSQELRLSYEGEKLRSTVGAYFYKDRSSYDSTGHINLGFLVGAYTGLPLGTGALPIALPFDPPINPGNPLGNIDYVSKQPPHVEDMALFGELDYALTPRFTVTAGLRGDREQNGRVISNTYQGDSPASEVVVQALFASGALPPNDKVVTLSREFSSVLPKLALRYEVVDHWFAGAAYARGYRPGGDGYNQVSGRYFTFDAEQTTNYELSLKGEYRPWRVDTALNLFYTRWDHMQVQLGSGTDNYMGNAGPAFIRGGELEGRWRALRTLRVVGGAGITWGRFGKGVETADGDLSGNRLPNAPPYTASLALEWTPLPGLLIRPDARWIGPAHAMSTNIPESRMPGYCLIDLALRRQIGRFSLFLTGSNLADKRWLKDANNYAAALGAGAVVSLGEARRISAGFDFQFH